MNSHLSITAANNYRRVWAALRKDRPQTVGEIQNTTHLTRPTIRAALFYLRNCGYARCYYRGGWYAVVGVSDCAA